MKRKIFVNGRIGRFDTPYFAFSDNEPLEISFVFDVIHAGRYVATFICGNARQTERLEQSKPIILQPEFLKEGTCKPLHVLLEMRSWHNDNVVIPSDPARGGYFIEPLFIDTVSVNYTAYGMLQALENKINALEERLVGAETKLKTYEEVGVPTVAETEYTSEENTKEQKDEEI